MTSRQAGRRVACISAQRRSTKAKAKSVRQNFTQHTDVRQPGKRKEEPLLPRERRRLIQLVICGGIFVLLVAAKLLLPERMSEINGALSKAMEQNVDVQAVFSAVGKAFSGQSNPSGAADEIYQAVFHPDEVQKTQETSVQLPIPQDAAAMEVLQTYLVNLPASEETSPPSQPSDPTQEASQAQISNLAHVLYSNKNLPENVCMEQSILNFDYCVPVNGTLSSDFGYRDHPVEGEERFHYGVDLAANSGTEIVCFADGTVTAVGESSSYGKYCTVTHPSGYSTLYAHCSRITVSSGTAVTKGQKIAEVGETGIATGPHLHFELQKDGTYLNPIYYVS